MLARHLITTDIQAAACGSLRLALFNTTARASMNVDDEEKPEKPSRQLREWRKPPPREWSPMMVFQSPMSKGDSTKGLGSPTLYAPIELKRWWRSRLKDYNVENQRFIKERHQILGCDLAAAHFLVYRGGRVKFLGQDDWMDKELGDLLPTRFDPYWQLTHIDTSAVQLYYIGLENLLNLDQVKWASFRCNPHFDDWCIDKVIAQIPNLEYLDLSECKLFSERGLASLWRLPNLKTVIVTDWKKTPSFELTCVMLEDVNNELKIIVREPGEKELQESD